MGPGATPPTRRPPVGALTVREQQLADLASAGLSSAEIAAELTLSVRTVEHHLSSVYAKLGLRSRAELAAQFRESRTPARPETKYARSKHGHIAYQVIGDGDRDVVLVPGFVSNVETGWDWPELASFLERLSAGRRLIIFDKRGTGLSDPVRDPSALTLEDRMDDIAAVLDAAHCERATVIGFSEGAALGLLFAGVRPERTNGLVLFGAVASAHLNRETVLPKTTEEARHQLEAAWGTGLVLATACPSTAASPNGLAQLGKFERHGSSPGGAYDLYVAFAAIEARNLCAAVQVPTLVMHRTGDRFAGIENGRFLAEALPRVSYIELAGDDHPPWLGDVDLVFTHLERFLSRDHRIGEESRSVLTTVVRCDATTLVAPSLIERHQGRPCHTPRGLAYLFDSPTRAIAFATHLVREHDDARAAIHSGEVIHTPEGATGAVVEVVSTMLAAVAAGEAWMSLATASLLGSPIPSADRAAIEIGDGHLLTVVQAAPG